MTWVDLMAAWDAIEADFHSEYGIADIDADDVLDRPWRWLVVRILGLIRKPDTRTYHATRKPPPPRPRRDDARR